MSQCLFVHHKSYMTSLGLNPGRHGGKPATNRLSYGTGWRAFSPSLHVPSPISIHHCLIFTVPLIISAIVLTPIASLCDQLQTKSEIPFSFLSTQTEPASEHTAKSYWFLARLRWQSAKTALRKRWPQVVLNLLVDGRSRTITKEPAHSQLTDNFPNSHKIHGLLSCTQEEKTLNTS
jgi:hypothetical protein